MFKIWKYLLICLICLCSILPAVAQTMIQGRVVDDTGKAVANCSVLLKSGQVIVKFASTDQHGLFSLPLPGNLPLDSCVLETNHLSYNSKTVALRPGVFQYEISVSAKSNLIDEVKIGRPPILQRTDTLRFDVAYFAGAADRSIGDVLRNMPGIEVDNNGRIKYNGQAISDFYIDGDDLMGNKYGVATKVVPHEMIEAIEVIRNHQRIKALEDKVFSDNVAMNLVVKNDRKMDLSGQASVGLGLPEQYDGEVNTILFNKKIKMLHLLSGNNAGRDLGKDQQDLVNLSEFSSARASVLQTGTNRVNPDDFNSFHDNRSTSLSGNILFDLANNWKMRVNLSAYLDRLRMDTHDQTHYFSPDGDFENTEKASLTFRPLETQSEFHLSKNEKEKYITNTLSGSFRQQRSANDLWTGDLPFRGDLRQQFWQVKNHFRLIPRPGKSGIWNYHLSMDSRRTPERLSFNPAEALGLTDLINNGIHTVGQDFTHGLLQGNAGLQFIPVTRQAWFRHHYQVELEAGEERIESQLWTDNYEPVQEARFRNDLGWQQYQWQGSAYYEFHFARILIRTIWPMTYRNIAWKDNIHDFSGDYKKWQITPHFNVRFDLTNRQNLQFTYVRNQQTGKIWSLYRGAVMLDHLTFRNSRSALPYLTNDMANLSYSLESPSQMMFYKLTYQYSSTYSNTMSTRQVDDQQMEIGTVNTGHRIESRGVNASISRFIHSLKGKMSLFAEIQQRHQNQLFNERLLHTSTTMITFQPNFNAQVLPQWKLTYEGDMLWGWTTADKEAGLREKSNSSTHKLRNVYSPVKNWHITATGQYLMMGLDGTGIDQFRLEGSVRYKSARTKLEYECMLSNLTNARDFHYTYIDENYSIQKYQQLRGRMMMLKVVFPF